MPFVLEEKKIQNAVHSGEPVEYKFEYVDNTASEFVVNVLQTILADIRKNYLKEEMTYILRELVANANKSNLKRIYFKNKGLDILDPAQYQQGMKNFLAEFVKNLDTYSGQFKKYSLYTCVSFQVIQNRLKVAIKNSNCPSPVEIERVSNLIEKSKSIRNPAEAFLSLMDTTEGAGLGTVSTMLMIRSMGLDIQAYQFTSDPQANETQALLNIPLDTVTESQVESISEIILSEVVSLPMFPENINHLERLISQGNDFSQMAAVIQSDPSLTAELLRIVNSVQYMLPQKVANITNALSLIGIRGLKGLLYSYGAQKILDKKYGKLEHVWEHAYRTASYAYHLAQDFGMKNICDDAYTGGILHDMGKLVILHAHPGLLEKITKHCDEIGMEGHIMENLTVGLSHAKVGAQIASKWNFPDAICDMIGYHHQPLLAPEESLPLVAIVYFANLLTKCHEAGFLFAALEKTVLDRFQIKNMEDLLKLEKKLDNFYLEQKKKAQEC